MNGFPGLLILAAFSVAWSARTSKGLDFALLQEKRFVSRRLDDLQGLEAGVPLKLASLSSWEPWESEQKLKVVYGVFTSPLPKYEEQMAAVADTWAQEVPPQKLLVVGGNGSVPGITYMQAPMCQDGNWQNPGLSCKEATILTTGYEMGADWVVAVGSDNYVFPKNFEERLQREDPTKPQTLALFGCGGNFCEDHKPGICGGPGYAISRGALGTMIGKAEDASKAFIEESMHTASTVSGFWSDQTTSCIARRRGVEEVDLLGLYGWRLSSRLPTGWEQLSPATSSFYGLKIFNSTNPKLGMFNETIYRQAVLSSTPKPLTFHYISPMEMRRIHEFVKAESPGNATALIQYKSEGAASSADNSWHILQRKAYIQQVNEERSQNLFTWIDTAKPI